LKCKGFYYLPHFDVVNNYYSSAKPTRIDSFMKLIAPFGILESARTGLMALPRSPLYGPNEQEMLKEADDIVDASSLPPG
jgi:acetolactate synthase-1/3 small subunit